MSQRRPESLGPCQCLGRLGILESWDRLAKLDLETSQDSAKPLGLRQDPPLGMSRVSPFQTLQTLGMRQDPAPEHLDPARDREVMLEADLVPELEELRQVMVMAEGRS